MSKYNNNKKKQIMQNIQRLRNEIEEIRIQNLSLMENLIPYEKWYKDADEIISSARMRRKPKHHKSVSFIHRLPRSLENIFSSLSSENSDSENIPNKHTVQRKDGDDDDYIENKDFSETKHKDLPNQKIDLTRVTQYLQNQGYKSPGKIFNTNVGTTLRSISIANQVQSNAPYGFSPNYSTPAMNQNQEISKPNNQLNLYQTTNQLTNQYSPPANLQLIQTNSQNQDISKNKPNQFIYNTSIRSVPKISQIGPNSMLSNIVSQQKNATPSEENISNIKSPQRILNQVPLSKNLTNIQRKNPQTTNTGSSNYNNTYFNNYYKYDVMKTIENNLANSNNNGTIISLSESDKSNNEYDDTDTINSNENIPEINKSHNFADDEETDENDSTSSRLSDLQLDFLLEPPPIPEIKILNRNFGESSDSEDQIAHDNKENMQYSQQTNQQTVLTPIFKFG